MREKSEPVLTLSWGAGSGCEASRSKDQSRFKEHGGFLDWEWADKD